MTPDEIGEYVANSVRMSPETRFLFISGQNDGVDVDVCHVGNGPKGPWNAKLIAAAPELLEALENVAGFIDTPIMRRKLGIDQQNPPEWIESVRSAIRKAKGETQ